MRTQLYHTLQPHLLMSSSLHLTLLTFWNTWSPPVRGRLCTFLPISSECPSPTPSWSSYFFLYFPTSDLAFPGKPRAQHCIPILSFILLISWENSHSSSSQALEATSFFPDVFLLQCNASSRRVGPHLAPSSITKNSMQI